MTRPRTLITLLLLVLALALSACSRERDRSTSSTADEDIPPPPPPPPDPDEPCKQHLAGRWSGGGVSARFSGSFVSVNARGRYRRELVLYSGCDLTSQVYVAAGDYSGRVIFHGDNTIQIEAYVLGSLRSWYLHREEL